jgi:hypothetical protein
MYPRGKITNWNKQISSCRPLDGYPTVTGAKSAEA